MLTDLVREFCKKNHYEVYENYQKTAPAFTLRGEIFGGETYTTLGIVIGPDDLVLDVLEQFFSYIIEKGLLEQVFDEINGFAEEALGPDSVLVYFPSIQDYHPPQP